MGVTVPCPIPVCKAGAEAQVVAADLIGGWRLRLGRCVLESGSLGLNFSLDRLQVPAPFPSVTNLKGRLFVAVVLF